VDDADELGEDEDLGEVDELGDVDFFTGLVGCTGGDDRLWCTPGVVATWFGAVGAETEGAGLLFCACGAAGVVASLSVVWF
jgi:hypothetical protein